MARLSPKQTKVLIAVVIVIVMAAGILTGVLVPLSRPLATPQEVGVAYVTGEPTYRIRLQWAEVTGAVGYRIEYVYDLLDETEVLVKTVEETYVEFERVRGTLRYRVRALHRYPQRDSAFSDWKTYDVEGFVLDSFSEAALQFLPSTDDMGNPCYRINTAVWSDVTYVYRSHVYHVEFYQLATVAPNTSEIVALENAQIYSADELKDHKFYMKSGTYRFYIRPVNYAYFGEAGAPVYDPRHLYTLYAVPDWTIVEFTAA